MQTGDNPLEAKLRADFLSLSLVLDLHIQCQSWSYWITCFTLS